MSLKVITDLNRHYYNRSISFTRPSARISIIDNGKNKYVQIYDTNLSKNLLDSKKLIAFDYYSEGINSLINAGESLDHLRNFWQESLLFINGSDHKTLKLKLIRQVHELDNFFISNETVINDFFEKNCLSSELTAISNELINASIAILLARITRLSPEQCMELLSHRKPVFYGFFHTVHQLKMGKLIENFIKNNDLTHLSKEDKFLLISLILMGIDPLVSTLISSKINDLDHHYLHTPSVSFITRKSNEPIFIDELNIDPGSIFNLSLVPNKSQFIESNYCPMNFGYGNHKCLGAKLSETILRVTHNYLKKKDVTDIHSANLKISNEGSFLRIER